MELHPDGPATGIKRKLRRSHTGCQKCRQTKVKCDEAQPQCARCVRLRHHCDYSPRPRKKYTRRPKLPAVDAILSGQNSPVSAASSSQLSIRSNRDTVDSGFGDAAWATATTSRGSRVLDLSSVSPEAASVLDPLDHAALHYFRFVLPVSVDGKDPRYSGPAVIWALAEKNVMVMHSVCALAGRKMCEKPEPTPLEEAHARRCLAVEHCAEALRMLNMALEGHGRAQDLNCILAALWMMIKYEQDYGDGSGHGFRAHLRGAAAMYTGRIGNIANVLPPIRPSGTVEMQPDMAVPSPLTCQLMVWIGLVDGGAAINGLGGAFCRLLGESQHSFGRIVPSAQLDIFRALQKRADMAPFELWGPSYPQDEMVDDLQNSQLMGLQAEIGQLRYLLSYLTEEHFPDIASGSAPPGTNPRLGFEKDIHLVIRDLETRHSGIFRLSGSLDTRKMASPSQKRFAVSARHICAFFHACVLCFQRIIRGPQPPDAEQRNALREIMTLASLAHQDNGEDGMVQFGWTLFVAALESDDFIHRKWLLERIELLARRGENFRRAHNALRIAFSEQGPGDRRLAYAWLVRRPDIERFVLT
ncbi:hypothetical protein NLU13_6598 [Sarocladium strictum]|uniref:Zn(2)-C6 fungal-type domain-containing protein n=1 Tax=Sarocladium strictum TaxID=5046 RepID=A0AA39L7A7_SARSR|nr:hypothetical protein NLU13_6598 [Sarocladium strictum]